MERTIYHPHEILLRGPDAAVSSLRLRLAEAFAPERRVASLHHAAEALPQPDEDGRVLSLALAGTATRWELPSHPDPALLPQLASSCEIALVQGGVESSAPRVVWTDAATGLEAMAGAVALCGHERPARVPPGGVPFFGSDELAELALHLEELLTERVRSRPLLGVIAGCRDAATVQQRAGLLEGLVEELFVAGESVLTSTLPGWMRPVTRTFAGAGYVGDLLAASAALAGCGLLVVSGREGDAVTRAGVESLIEQRDALADATALRGGEDSLPRNGAVLWEAKGLGRLWGFLGAGVRCPQRILNQSRTKLVEPG